jgi:hypothetical protein
MLYSKHLSSILDCLPVSMEPAMDHTTCQSCRRPATPNLLSYRKGGSVVHNESLLQCDICERYACAECLQVYDIISGYDFLCHDCARSFEPPPPGTRGH